MNLEKTFHMRVSFNYLSLVIFYKFYCAYVNLIDLKSFIFNKNFTNFIIQVTVKLDVNGKCKKCSVEPLSMWTRPSDFPVINPNFHGARHQYVYVATSSGSHQALPNFPFDTIVKLDTLNRIVQTWSTSKDKFIGEPMFVPKAMPVDEDDGYLLVVEVNNVQSFSPQL